MSRPSVSRGNWTLREDGSQRFEASRDGTQMGIHGAVIQAPARSSSSLPSPSRPRTADTDDDRLPLPRLSSGGVREIRPLTSQFSSSSDDQPAPGYPPQINPYAPYGDHRPQQPTWGSSPPRPTSLDQLMSDGPIDPRRPVSQGSSASDSSLRPTSPTPLPRRELINRLNGLSRSLNPTEMQSVTNPRTTDTQLSRVLNAVTMRMEAERRAAWYQAQQRPRGGRR
jgi:hypothetical protein